MKDEDEGWGRREVVMRGEYIYIWKVELAKD